MKKITLLLAFACIAFSCTKEKCYTCTITTKTTYGGKAQTPYSSTADYCDGTPLPPATQTDQSTTKDGIIYKTVKTCDCAEKN